MGFGRVSSQQNCAITSCELFARMSATQRKVRSHEDIKLDNQLSGGKRTSSYFLLVATNKTIHSPTSRIVIFFIKIL